MSTSHSRWISHSLVHHAAAGGQQENPSAARRVNHGRGGAMVRGLDGQRGQACRNVGWREEDPAYPTVVDPLQLGRQGGGQVVDLQ